MLVCEHLRPAPSPVAVVAGLLRGQARSGDWLASPENQASCVAAGRRHGVVGLLARRLESSSASYPAAFTANVKRVARAEVVIEHCRRNEVVRVLSALHESDIRALILKGTALGYTHY